MKPAMSSSPRTLVCILRVREFGGPNLQCRINGRGSVAFNFPVWIF
jgi:hypothetical protein